MTNVIVYLNEHRDHWFGYERGHPLRKVFEFELLDQSSAEYAAELTFDLFNIDLDLAGPRSRQVIERYRAAGNRSLSVGDVLLIDGAWLACARAGWYRLAAAPSDGELS